MLDNAHGSAPQTYATLAEIWRKHDHKTPLMLTPDTRLRAESFWDKAEQYYVSAFAVQFHEIYVLWFLADGRIIINVGKHNVNVTTRQRINKFLPSGWQVVNKDGGLFISSPDGDVRSYDYSDLNIFQA